MTLKERASSLKREIPAVFLTLRDERTPVFTKILAAVTVAYALSPVDLIPDFVPVLGYLDDLIIQSTGYCMSKVEEDFMAKAPADVDQLWRFIEEVPYWTAEKHGKKYRLMYQVYTHPKYREHGQRFFSGVDER